MNAVLRIAGAPGRTGRARRVLRRGRSAGLGVVELLISLAISATVLAAVAFAVDATFRAYSINQEQSDLMQRARLAMYRLVTTVRTTSAHQPISAVALSGFKDGLIVTDTGLVMLDANDAQVSYKFDAPTSELRATDGSGREYVLLRGVKKFELKLEPMRSQQSVRTGGPYDRLMRATILITIRTAGNSADVDEKVASQEVTLSTSVMPRRNIW
jgi:hypothetical protein